MSRRIGPHWRGPRQWGLRVSLLEGTDSNHRYALTKGSLAERRCRTDKLDGVIEHRSCRGTTVVGRGPPFSTAVSLTTGPMVRIRLPPGIAAPNAVPIERTEVKADAVLRCSSEATLSIARATRCTLYTPMPIPITNALIVISASPAAKPPPSGTQARSWR
jgi:hypothetical protein